MVESNSESEKKDSGKSSTKKLVRILVVVGIGIPVLVELLTLFNLINVQLLEEDEKAPKDSRDEVTEIRTFTEGDTVYSDSEIPVLIKEMKVKVSAQQWRLDLQLGPADTMNITRLKNINRFLRLDSLQLKSGMVLKKEQLTGIQNLEEVEEATYDYKAELKLPSGDIPRVLYITSFQPVSSDSVMSVSRTLRLGNIPIRYEQ